MLADRITVRSAVQPAGDRKRDELSAEGSHTNSTRCSGPKRAEGYRRLAHRWLDLAVQHPQCGVRKLTPAEAWRGKSTGLPT
jgi:hypothetical protein